MNSIRLGQLEKWDAFLGHFQRALDRTAVPAEEQVELKAVVNSTRSQVVASGAAVA
jgi:truncated hemoglobin YjbI